MRVLHYFPQDNSMISAYVSKLCEGMGLECLNEKVTDSSEAQQHLRQSHYDILHLHGCWRNSSYLVARQAFAQGTRLIVSPHGQLEPWEMDDGYWKEKLPKRLLYQKRLIQQAYAVVIQGKMEEECLRKLGWNPRAVIIKNALITHSTTLQQMASQTFRLYRKVMDSNPWQLMSDELKSIAQQYLKVGITGDVRWMGDERYPAPSTQEDWRLLLCYAHQEQLMEPLRQGLRIMGVEAPDLDLERIDCFYPDGYEAPKSIESVIGMMFASENDRLMATFRHLRKLVLRRQLTMMHLIELDKELRHHTCDEELLAETLKEQNLYKLAGRLMQVMQSLTGFTEGFMPVPPLNDRLAKALQKQVENHLKI